MRLSVGIRTMAAAGVLLAGALATTAHAGWFGLGDSDKSSKTSKVAKSTSRTPSRVGTRSSTTTSESKKGLWDTVGGWFGGKKQPEKKRYGPYVAKSDPKDNQKSWWNTWWKPKESPPPKSTSDWMKLEQVRW